MRSFSCVRGGLSAAGLLSTAGLLSAAVLAFGLALAGHAGAQGQLPDVAPIGAQPSKKPQGPPPGTPETHAAAGEESTLSTGDEPALPADPLAMSDETKAQIGSDYDPDTAKNKGPIDRRFYGLYYSETSPTERYRLVFPLWAERIKTLPSAEPNGPPVRDRASAYGGFYYNRRGPQNRDDILFPIFWNLENPMLGSRTTVVGPFVNRRTKTETDDWLLPLYATGTREHGGYTLIPALLTSLHATENGGFNLVGPSFCSWSGGERCDTRTATSIDLGIAPFYFFGQNQRRLYEVVPPLLHYYGYQARSESWLNVWGPYYRQRKGERERDLFHLLPLYYSIWGKDERHTTVLPLFHYGYKGEENLLITPLFMNKVGENGAKTFVTWGYARHRGPSELDMITPLYWAYRVPSIGLNRKLVLPFLYTQTSPRENTVVFFPFFSDKLRFGVSRSTWVTPIFNFHTHERGWSMALAPLLFFGRNNESHHRIVAPLYFDFESRVSRTTVGFPLFWRFAAPTTTSTVVANVLHRVRRSPAGNEWEFHFMPLFSMGKSPDGHFWNLLFGFAGYTQKGTASTMRLFYLPVELSR